MSHYFWVFIEKFGTVLLKLSLIVLLARLLTPKDFGLYAIVAIIVSMATLLVDSGMGGSLIKKKDITDLDYSTVFIFNFVVAVGLYVLIYLFSPMIAEFYKEYELELLIKISSLNLIIRSLTLIQFAKLSKELKFQSQSFIYIISLLFSIVFAYYLAINNYGYWALVGQQLLESCLVVIFTLMLSRYSPPIIFSTPIFISHFSFASKLMLSSLLEIMNRNIVLVIAGKSLGMNGTGFYAQTVKINELSIRVLTEIVEKTSFPILVKHFSEPREYLLYASQLIRLVSLIGFFCVAILVSCADLIIEIVLGSNWNESVWMLQIIGLTGYGVIMEAVNRSILKSAGRSDLILRMGVIKSITTIGILLLLANFGMYTILWGMFVLSLFNAFLNIYTVSKILNYSIIKQLKDVSWAVFSSIFIMLLVIIFIKNVELPLYINFIISILLAALCYFCLLLLFNRIDFLVIKNILFHSKNKVE